MISYNIVLVPFPFDDFTSTKVRPAICLTPEIGKFEHIVVAFISSNTNFINEDFDIIIKKQSPLHPESGLHFDSVIKMHRLTTIRKTHIKRKLGKANPLLSQKIKMKLNQLFEIEKM